MNLLIKLYGCIFLLKAQNKPFHVPLCHLISGWTNQSDKVQHSPDLNLDFRITSETVTVTSCQVVQKPLISLLWVETSSNLFTILPSAVILTSPGFQCWDTGPAPPEVWRLVAHGAQTDDCIYFREFIAFYQPLIAETRSSLSQASACLCAVLLLLPGCLTAQLKFPSNFHKSTLTVHAELRHLCARAHRWSLHSFFHGDTWSGNFSEMLNWTQ